MAEKRDDVVPLEVCVAELGENGGKEGTQGGMAFEETQRCDTFVKRWHAVLDAGTPGEGAGLPPIANHEQKLTKGIEHGERDLKVDGEWSFCLCHVAGDRCFADVLGVPVDFIGTQDLGCECHSLWWTNVKRQSTDEWKEDGGNRGDAEDFDASADERQSYGCRTWCGQGPGARDTGHRNTARIECGQMIVSTQPDEGGCFHDGFFLLCVSCVSCVSAGSLIAC